MRRLVATTLALGVLLWGAGAAHAHDPIILTPEQSSPSLGPVLPDGTVSFALYGTIESPGETRGFRVRFVDGDALYLSILIPDLGPENELPDDQLPYLIVRDPNGGSSEIRASARVAFPEPFTGTNYIRLADVSGPAVAGEYEVTITGDAAARFTVSVGTKELFGTEVENVPNRDLGVGGVMTWYATPPSSPPPTEAPDITSSMGSSPTVTSTPTVDEAAPNAVEGAASPATGGSGATTVVVVIAALAVAGLVAVVVRRRR